MSVESTWPARAYTALQHCRKDAMPRLLERASQATEAGFDSISIDIFAAERRFGPMTHAQRLDGLLPGLVENLPGYRVTRVAHSTFKIEPVPADRTVWESVLLILANRGLQLRI